jgi:hypothetical protein
MGGETITDAAKSSACGFHGCAALTMSIYDALLITTSRHALTRSTCNMTPCCASMTAVLMVQHHWLCSAEPANLIL